MFSLIAALIKISFIDFVWKKMDTTCKKFNVKDYNRNLNLLCGSLRAQEKVEILEKNQKDSAA